MEFGRCYFFGIVLIGLLNIGTFGDAQVLVAPTHLTCPEGYILYNNGLCYDVDECRGAVFPCNQNQLCYNTPGSYVCANVAGNAPKPGPEVTQKPIAPIPARPASQQPTPTPAAKKTIYSDNCPEGYTNIHPMLYTSALCYDIDECSGPIFPCAQNEYCINTEGSYHCTASPTGYAAQIKPNQKLGQITKASTK